MARWVHGWVEQSMKKEEKAPMGTSELEQPCRVVLNQAEMAKPLCPHINQSWPVDCPGRDVTSQKETDS